MSTRDSDTEAFARRLSGIRDGSGRSYGALARRVGVSASTLHRYCSGRTVPLEFAPVERLARLCGCQGEELIALHRLWVLADAERRRRQEDAAAGASAANRAAGQSGAGAEPVPAPESVPEQGPGLEPGSEPELGRVSSVEGVASVAAAEVVPPAERVRDAPTGRAVTRRRHQAAYAALAVVTVVALVLLAFDWSPLPAAGDQRGAEQRTTQQYAGARPSGDGTVAPPSADGPSPLASASPTAPRPAATAPPSTPTHSARPPAGPARPKPSVPARNRSGGTPFTWSVDQHVWQNGCQHSYLIDRAPSAVPPPPAESDAESWSRSLGALHADETAVRITVQGRNDEAVVLQSLRVRVAAKRPPQARNVYRMSLGCGGSITPRMFDVDLDGPRPIARSVAGSDSGVPIPAVSFPYRVSVRDPEVLLVTGRTAGCDCDWYLELKWSSGDRSGVVRIDDDGRPFRTSGGPGRPTYEYDTITGRWARASS
ncbi:helix-turn-helix domain-containing protein [Streptomyces sp. NPDC020965]|uniref:transcriptional regulator n=1 Tax=Streptomyces sp. NPDC020965 TaxID=3365105 RepID=UPI00379946EE